MTIPARSGPQPQTTSTNPHQQLDQHPPESVFAQLCERLFALPGVIERPSAVSVPGARALWLDPKEARGPREAFLVMPEFAHVHPLPDGSLHVALPPQTAEEAIRRGWAEQHPVAKRGLIPPNVCMVYAPRTTAESDVVVGLVAETLDFARGERSRDEPSAAPAAASVGSVRVLEKERLTGASGDSRSRRTGAG